MLVCFPQQSFFLNQGLHNYSQLINVGLAGLHTHKSCSGFEHNWKISFGQYPDAQNLLVQLFMIFPNFSILL